MKTCGIYAIVNVVTERQYIGSSADVRTRWRKHRAALDRGVHRNRHLQGAWRKYGTAAFRFDVLEVVENARHLAEREQFYLDQRQPHVYNVSVVAEAPMRGRTLTADQRAKISAANTGRPRTAAQLAVLQRTRQAPRTAEARAKMSAAHKGRPQSPEWIAKRAETRRGQTRPDARARMVGNRICVGRVQSAETRARISAAVAASWARRRADKEITANAD